MQDGQSFTDEELELLAQLGDAARADPRPTLSADEVRRSLRDLHDQTMREQRKLG